MLMCLGQVGVNPTTLLREGCKAVVSGETRYFVCLCVHMAHACIFFYPIMNVVTVLYSRVIRTLLYERLWAW